MEKGFKNLQQAHRSAQKKQGITYHDHCGDSGIGISDLDEESEDNHTDMPSMSEAHYTEYAEDYPPNQQRVPSIQSMLHPTQYSAHQMGQPQ